MSANGFNGANGNNREATTYDDEKPQKSGNMLSKLDNAKFSLFHVKAVIIAGVGFFTDAYDLFVISLVAKMISMIYFRGKIRTGANNALTGTALAGTLVGQVAFGAFGDVLGRKKMYMISLVMMIVFTIFSAFSQNFDDLGLKHSLGIVEVLCIYRFLLGVGIGGDYPLSAVITSEYSASMFRGTLIALVFSMQGIGVLAAAVVSVVVIKIFGRDGSIDRDVTYLDNVWRLIVGLGIVPAIATIYLRFMLPETPRYTLQVENDQRQAQQNIQDVTDGTYVPKEHDEANLSKKEEYTWMAFMLFLKDWGWILCGTAGAWFFLDIAYYSLQLYTPTVLTEIGYAKSSDPPYRYVFTLAGGQAILALCGTVPGYFVTVALVDVWGRKPIQIMGFAVVTTLCLILAAGYNQIVAVKTHKPMHRPALFVVFYALLFFFSNFGPNTTTFIIPGEVFPTKYRSTAHGLSAAAGKAGALIGVFGLNTSKANPPVGIGEQKTWALLCAFELLGLFCTFLIPETKGKTLEELGEGIAIRSKLERRQQKQEQKSQRKGNGKSQNNPETANV